MRKHERYLGVDLEALGSIVGNYIFRQNHKESLNNIKIGQVGLANNRTTKGLYNGYSISTTKVLIELDPLAITQQDRLRACLWICHLILEIFKNQLNI